jgi:Helix-turn-helix domain
MSVEAMSWVIKNSKAKLGDFIVLLMVANQANADGSGSWPSVATLAKNSRLSERETRYCLRNLEKLGELSTILNGGPKGTNAYRVNMDQGSLLPLGANSAGGNPRQKQGQPIAPEPSLPILPSLSLVFDSFPLKVNTTQDQKLEDVYPWVDRQLQYKKMELWATANRPGRKVKNVLAFCQNWFNKIPCPAEGGNANGNRAKSFEQQKREREDRALSEVDEAADRLLQKVEASVPDTRSLKGTTRRLLAGS